MTATYDCIATTTLGSNQSDVTFSTISGSYTDLVLVIQGDFDADGDVRFRINSDTGSNYSFTHLWGDGSTAGSVRTSNATSGSGDYYGNITTTLGNSVQIFQFMNYANTTTYKTVISRANQAGGGVDATVNLWRSTSAITSLSFARNSGFGGTWQIGSTFTLYGIKSE